MLKRLQRLKANRGFTILELIIVIAVIGILIGTVLGGLDTQHEKILEANTTASDFYSAIQTEFINFQMFDGPLTVQLGKEYAAETTIGSNGKLGGIKYYPLVGGNYPYDGGKLAGETHQTGAPKESQLYVEFQAKNGILRRVNYASDIDTLIGYTDDGNTDAQICLVLQQEMAERMYYMDGYYYARISYTPPASTPVGLSKHDYRKISVKVDWAAFSYTEITDENSATFKKQNILNNGYVCGVHTTLTYPSLGTTGTSILDA